MRCQACGRGAMSGHINRVDAARAVYQTYRRAVDTGDLTVPWHIWAGQLAASLKDMVDYITADA